MTNSEYIYQKVNELMKKVGSREPLKIADELGIDIYYNGDFDKLLGFYTQVKKKRAIVINNRLDEYMARMVLAHELGHDALHRNYTKTSPFQEFVLFDMKDNKEYEANVFAAHLLLDTDEILELAQDGLDVYSIASTMCVNINLVLIKISEMITLGYDLRMPLDTKKDFLRDIII